MKKYIIVLVLFAGTVYGHAQTVGITYDACGNRLTRYIVTTSTKSAEEISQLPSEEFKLGEESQILLYPNPTAGILNFRIINSSLQEAALISIKVYAVDGSLINDKKFKSLEFEIDSSKEPNGTYLLDLFLNNAVQHFTIIKK